MDPGLTEEDIALGVDFTLADLYLDAASSSNTPTEVIVAWGPLEGGPPKPAYDDANNQPEGDAQHVMAEVVPNQPPAAMDEHALAGSNANASAAHANALGDMEPQPYQHYNPLLPPPLESHENPHEAYMSSAHPKHESDGKTQPHSHHGGFNSKPKPKNYVEMFNTKKSMEMTRGMGAAALADLEPEPEPEVEPRDALEAARAMLKEAAFNAAEVIEGTGDSSGALVAVGNAADPNNTIGLMQAIDASEHRLEDQIQLLQHQHDLKLQVENTYGLADPNNLSNVDDLAQLADVELAKAVDEHKRGYAAASDAGFFAGTPTVLPSPVNPPWSSGGTSSLSSMLLPDATYVAARVQRSKHISSQLQMLQEESKKLQEHSKALQERAWQMQTDSGLAELLGELSLPVGGLRLDPPVEPARPVDLMLEPGPGAPDTPDRDPYRPPLPAASPTKAGKGKGKGKGKNRKEVTLERDDDTLAQPAPLMSFTTERRAPQPQPKPQQKWRRTKNNSYAMADPVDNNSAPTGYVSQIYASALVDTPPEDASGVNLRTLPPLDLPSSSGTDSAASESVETPQLASMGWRAPKRGFRLLTYADPPYADVAKNDEPSYAVRKPPKPSKSDSRNYSSASNEAPLPKWADCHVGSNDVRASCYCTGQAPKRYADIQNDCTGFFVCTHGSPKVYVPCYGILGGGLLNEVGQ
eukprot:gene16346-22541_t